MNNSKKATMSYTSDFISILSYGLRYSFRSLWNTVIVNRDHLYLNYA